MSKLKNERLKEIAQELEKANLKEDAFFNIHEIPGGEFLYLSANKEGLELYAAQLLKASSETEEILSHKERNIFPLAGHEENWLNGEYNIDYVEPSLEKRKPYKIPVHTKTWKEKVLLFSLLGVLILIAFLVIVGLINVIGWIV